MPKDHTNYYHVKCSAYAKLGGEEVDITGFEAVYELNQVPSIKIFPTVGKDPSSGKEAEAVSKFLAATQYTELQVFAKFETELDNPESGDPGFPYDTDVKIFDGYVLGCSYVAATAGGVGALQLECTGAGWLAGLGGTDVNSVGTTLKGPLGWTELANPTAEKGGKPGVFDINAPLIAREPTFAIEDLWVGYVKEVFYLILNNERVWGDTPNDPGKDALDRMDKQEIFKSPTSTGVLKLEFGRGNVDDETLAQYLAQQVSKVLFSTWRSAGGSLWDALLELARIFKFKVVPLIDTAGCCPVYGPLSGDPYKTITTADYTSINILTGGKATSGKAGDRQLVVMQYAVVGSMDKQSSTRSKTPKIEGLIGSYSLRAAKAGFTNGQSIVVQAPMWLAAEAPIGRRSRQSLGEKFLIADAANPDALTKEPEDDWNQIYNDIIKSELGDNYAQTLLQEANLSGRAGGLQGRFRLDISPGSMIRFEVIDDKFASESEDPQYMYGLVNSVKLILKSGGQGAASGTASTVFGLQYVRTQEEHEFGEITNPTHPYWGEGTTSGVKFLGTKLWTE